MCNCKTSYIKNAPFNVFIFSVWFKKVLLFFKSLCFSQSNYAVFNDNQSDTFGLIFFSTLWKIQAYIFYSSMPIQPITHKKKFNRMISVFTQLENVISGPSWTFCRSWSCVLCFIRQTTTTTNLSFHKQGNYDFKIF